MRHARLLFLILVAAPLAASDLWFHLRVDDERHQRSTIRVNVPLSVVGRVAQFIPARHARHCSIDVEGDSFDYSEMRSLVLQTLQAAEGETFALRRDDATVLAVREKNGIKLFFHDHHRSADHVEISVPADVAAAMSRSEHPKTGLKAAIAAVASRGTGEVMTVRAEDKTVTMWIDRVPVSR